MHGRVLQAVSFGVSNLTTDRFIHPLPAAWSLRQLDREGWKTLVRCAAFVAGGASILLIAGGIAGRYVAERHAALHRFEWSRLALVGIRSLCLYFALSFVIEEVVIRGVLDAHVQRPAERARLASALFVSVLASG